MSYIDDNLDDEIHEEYMNKSIDDSIEFISDFLEGEVQLRQMIDSWCISQLGNTDETMEKADAMFTAARDIFYSH